MVRRLDLGSHVHGLRHDGDLPGRRGRDYREGLSGDSQASSSTPTALDVLNERYVRGEIDTADYEERKQQILGKG